MVAVPVGREVLQHAHETSRLDMRQDDVFRRIGETEAVECRIDDVINVVEGELPVDPDLQLTTVFLKIPDPEPTRKFNSL